MRIVNSVSAGYSSVMMAIKMREWYPDADMVNIMANTSKEREESLVFMHECDRHYNLNLVWVEADINPENREGTRHIVKTFETLTRDGSVFEKGIKKYGIPSVVNKWCNRELKLNPIHDYIKSIGWGKFGDYHTAIGFRIDEIDRMSGKEIRDKHKLLYPLIEHNIDQRERNRFWAQQPIQIGMSAYKGNCDMCFEKTNRKLCTIFKEEPEYIRWWLEMEEKYSNILLPNKPSYNEFIDRDGGHYSLRDNQSYKTIGEISRRRFTLATDEYFYENDLFDLGGSCDQGCNIYSFLDNAS